MLVDRGVPTVTPETKAPSPLSHSAGLLTVPLSCATGSMICELAWKLGRQLAYINTVHQRQVAALPVLERVPRRRPQLRYVLRHQQRSRQDLNLRHGLTTVRPISNRMV